MTNVEHVAEEIEEIASEFKKMTLFSILEGIKELADFISYIPVEFQQCEGI